MIPATKTHHVESTLQGEDIAMTLDQNSLAHLMAVMTDLYSDPELAVIREYSTNARDAHVAAGVDRPIEVELPTQLRPTLVIRDFGIGIALQEVRDIYSKYGASTKRGSNEATGMLGLGCKSALTYADQFTVESVKDGRRVVVNVSRDEKGSGTMKVLTDEVTDRGNGTTVTIPAQRHSSLADTATNFFRYWPAGSVLINGAEPERYEAFDIHEDGSLLVEPGSYYAEDKVVMGGVPYPADFGVQGVQMTAFVDIGTVDFTPSREALQETARTRAALEAIKARFIAACTAAVQREIDKAETRWEALAALGDTGFLVSHAARADLTYHGEALPDEFKSQVQGQRLTVVGQSYYRAEGNHAKVDMVRAHHTIEADIIITGYTNAKWTAPNRRRLDYYLDEVRDDQRTAVGAICLDGDALTNQEWIDPEKFVEWDVLKKLKLPEHLRSGGGVKIAGTYDVYGEGGRWIRQFPADEIDTEAALFYGQTHPSREQVSLIQEHWPGAVIAIVPSTREAKFLRVFSEAEPRHWSEGYQEAAQVWYEDLPLLDKQAIKIDDIGWRYGEGLDPEATPDPMDLDDPYLANELMVLRRRYELRPTLRMRRHEIAHADDSAVSVPDRVIDQYPLLHGLDSDQVQHGTIYANAVYAANQEETG